MHHGPHLYRFELLSGYALLETAAEKRLFRQSFSGRHYLVLSDGFYEWKTLDDGRKQPYHFVMKSGVPYAQLPFCLYRHAITDFVAPTLVLQFRE